MPQFCPENDHLVKKVINLKEKKARKNTSNCTKKMTTGTVKNYYS